MFKIFRFLKDFKKELIIGPAFKLTEAIFELIIPLLMAHIIDVGIKSGDTMYIIKVGGVMLLLGLLGLGCALTCQYNAAKASQGFGTKVRNALFAHINRLSVSEIDKIGSSGLITRMTNDINQLQLAVAMLIRLVIRAPFLIIGATAISIMLDFKLSMIFLVAIPLIILVLYAVMSLSVPLYRKVQQQLDKISLITRENLVGSRVIRAFVGQRREIDRFKDESETLKKSALRVGKLSALLSPITYIIINIAIIALVWLGGSDMVASGKLIALVQYMSQILLALVVVADLVIVFTKASASARRVNEVFDLSPTIIYNATGEVNIKNNNSAIVFNNVSFSYSKDGETALQSINVDIKDGQTIGIIGATGSGKSTLAKLINRTYDATNGEVCLFGNNIKNFSKSQLNSLVHIVPQKAVLFSGTIASNLLMGDSNATEEELLKALDIAGFTEQLASFPQGLQSPVEQGGKNFSGGQRQRLTIARAVLGKPKILILDDSSSALDYKTDSLVRTAIKNEILGTTVILISQRYTSIQYADFIIVMDDGEIAGVGTHTSLLEGCEVYKEICSSQQSQASVAEKGVIA